MGRQIVIRKEGVIVNEMDKQKQVLEISADLWNKFLEIPDFEKHLDDNNDFRHHLHAIQNIMFTQLYKKLKIN